MQMTSVHCALYLNICNDLQGNGRNVQGVHNEIHQVPPVVQVVLDPAVPHLFDLGPYKALRRRADRDTSSSDIVAKTAAHRVNEADHPNTRWLVFPFSVCKLGIQSCISEQQGEFLGLRTCVCVRVHHYPGPREGSSTPQWWAEAPGSWAAARRCAARPGRAAAGR